MKAPRFDLAIAIALVPVLGTGLVLMNQLGRFSYYGVPAEMLEIDAYKVLISSLSMFFVGTALLFTGATLYDSGGSRWWERLTFGVFFAAALTAAFWVRDLDWHRPVSWATVVFVAFTGLVIFGAERWARRESSLGPLERISGWALTAFFGSLLVLSATFAHGYLAERDRKTFTFVENSDDAVVGRSGDLLILKTYDGAQGKFQQERTKFLRMDDSTVLVTRTIPAR